MEMAMTWMVLGNAMIMGLGVVLLPTVVSAHVHGRPLQGAGPELDRSANGVLITEAQEPAMREQRVEFAIRESGYVQLTPPRTLRVGVPTVLVVRNQDIERHGFTSPMLANHMVRAFGEGIVSYGKGIEGFYIDPGKTLVIRFPLESKGELTFHCDLHPQMKGELFLLELPNQ